MKRQGAIVRRPILGFTLVELLIVIGIITLLVAILMPVLTKAREHANRVVCAAHLRAQGHALTMYVQQYRYYPCHRMIDPSLPGLAFAVWPTELRLFTGGDQGVFYCPSQDERCRWIKGAPPGPLSSRAEERHTGFGYEVGEALLLWQGPAGADGTYFSYGYNRWGTSHGLGLGDFVDVRIPPLAGSGHVHASSVRLPTEMIAIADASPSGGQIAFTIHPNPVNPKLVPGSVHNGGANVLFCDGHVQWYLQRDLVLTVPGTLDYERVARMWNITNTPYPSE